MKKILVALLPLIAIVAVFFLIHNADAQYNSTSAKKSAEKSASVDACYGCHDPIKQLHTMGKHAKINCVNCHSGLDKHLANPGRKRGR